MKREIKFRLIFDNKIVGYMQYMNQGKKPNLNWMYSKNDIDWTYDFDLAYTNIKQFTGLKDKNGKEIYEGDIIDFGGLKPIEIVWRDSGFKSRLIPYENSEPIRLTKEGMIMFGGIIGNIYENPELLK